MCNKLAYSMKKYSPVLWTNILLYHLGVGDYQNIMVDNGGGFGDALKVM